MDLSAMACRLLRLLRREPADRPSGPDAADMGTAFGLDASFDHPEVDPIPAGAAAADMPWEYRLTRRTGL